MLEHEPQSAANKTLSSGAAQTRVTAEEFTAAIDSLEQRKSAEASRLAGTVEIGQTIQDLHIDATPEEILREVESQRAQKMTQEQVAAEQRAKEAAEARERAAIAAARLKTSAQNAAAVALESFQQHEEQRRARRASAQVLPRRRKGGGILRLIVVLAIVALFVNQDAFHGMHVPGVTQPYTITDSDGTKIVLGPGGIVIDEPTSDHGKGPIRTVISLHGITEQPLSTNTGKDVGLSDVSDGTKVFSDTQGLKKLLDTSQTEGANAIQVHTAAFDNSWPIVRHGDHLYLEGFVAPVADNDLAKAPLTIAAYHNATLPNGVAAESVTIPIASDKTAGSAQSIMPTAQLKASPTATQMTLTNVSTDTHLHDGE